MSTRGQIGHGRAPRRGRDFFDEELRMILERVWAPQQTAWTPAFKSRALPTLQQENVKSLAIAEEVDGKAAEDTTDFDIDDAVL